MMNLPEQLISRPNWILWRNEDGRKIPYQVDGQKARSNDPATWVAFEQAHASVNGHSGLGFVFDGSGVFGIDLDGCIDDSGVVQDWARAILDQFPTYAEVSPSGHGVKIFGIGAFTGTGKKKSLDVPACCTKAPGVEVYGSGRYFTVTGMLLPGHPCELVDCQRSLDALLAWLCPPPVPQVVHVLPGSGTDVLERARRYLATMEVCDPRPEHPMDASTQLLKAAGAMVGFNLDDSTACRLLAEWDSANPCGPYPEKEYRRKLAEARKDRPAGWILAQDATEGGDVNLGPLLASSTAQAVLEDDDPLDDVPDDPHELPLNPATMPGLIGDIVRHNLRTALYPQPELALAGAIALMGTITGRKVADQQDTRTNVYVLGLAPSGSGKEHARKLNKEILLRAGAPKMVGPERIGSSAGLARCVRDQEAILFQLDEISRLLETTKSSKSAHLWNVPSVLLQLYGSSSCLWIGDAYAKADQTPVINQPHACIYGTSVPGPFWAAMTHENVSEGLLGRFLPFESGYVDMQAVQTEDVPQTIIDRVRFWTAMNPTENDTSRTNLAKENPKPIVFEHTSEARERFLQHAAEITRRRKTEDPARAAMWSRTIGNTAKLALIFACSDGMGRIELPHVNAAIRISNWATRRMLRMVFEYVAMNDREKELKRILRLVATPMTQNQLTRKTQNLKLRDRHELVSELIQTGLVEIVEEKTAGRSRKIIRQKVGWNGTLTKGLTDGDVRSA